MFEAHPINSLLETDLYKYSMGQVALHWFPRTNVKVEFKCRTDVNLGHLKSEIDKELDYLCTLSYTEDELNYLRSIPWFTDDFVDYLENFKFKRRYIHTDIDENGQLTMYAEGPWREVIYFEIPCLAIVQETYMKWYIKNNNLNIVNVIEEGEKNLTDAILKFKDAFKNLKEKTGFGFTLADFGIRRRFSGVWQDHVIDRFAKEASELFVGTSDVYLAKKYGIKPIGTFAHEFFQVLQGENIRLSEVQKTALDIWAKEYRGELGIALSDIFGFNAFLRDFDKYFAKLFDGCRHDSGNPITWGNMLINHYKKLNIDPITKIGCWSDSLNADKAIKIANEFCGKIKVSFGIGTTLTNNVGIKPLNIVMKITESNGHPTAKLSDSLGKGLCKDENFVNYLKDVYKYKSIDEN